MATERPIKLKVTSGGAGPYTYKLQVDNSAQPLLKLADNYGQEVLPSPPATTAQSLSIQTSSSLREEVFFLTFEGGGNLNILADLVAIVTDGSGCQTVASLKSTNDIRSAITGITTDFQCSQSSLTLNLQQLADDPQGNIRWQNTTVEKEPKQGKVAVFTNGTVVYTPNKDAAFVDTFDLRFADKNGETVVRRYTINIPNCLADCAGKNDPQLEANIRFVDENTMGIDACVINSKVESPITSTSVQVKYGEQQWQAKDATTTANCQLTNERSISDFVECESKLPMQQTGTFTANLMGNGLYNIRYKFTSGIPAVIQSAIATAIANGSEYIAIRLRDVSNDPVPNTFYLPNITGFTVTQFAISFNYDNNIAQIAECCGPAGAGKPSWFQELEATTEMINDFQEPIDFVAINDVDTFNYGLIDVYVRMTQKYADTCADVVKVIKLDHCWADCSGANADFDVACGTSPDTVALDNLSNEDNALTDVISYSLNPPSSWQLAPGKTIPLNVNTITGGTIIRIKRDVEFQNCPPATHQVDYDFEDCICNYDLALLLQLAANNTVRAVVDGIAPNIASDVIEWSDNGTDWVAQGAGGVEMTETTMFVRRRIEFNSICPDVTINYDVEIDNLGCVSEGLRLYDAVTSDLIQEINEPCPPDIVLETSFMGEAGSNPPEDGTFEIFLQAQAGEGTLADGDIVEFKVYNASTNQIISKANLTVGQNVDNPVSGTAINWNTPTTGFLGFTNWTILDKDDLAAGITVEFDKRPFAIANNLAGTGNNDFEGAEYIVTAQVIAQNGSQSTVAQDVLQKVYEGKSLTLLRRWIEDLGVGCGGVFADLLFDENSFEVDTGSGYSSQAPSLVSGIYTVAWPEAPAGSMWLSCANGGNSAPEKHRASATNVPYILGDIDGRVAIIKSVNNIAQVGIRRELVRPAWSFNSPNLQTTSRVAVKNFRDVGGPYVMRADAQLYIIPSLANTPTESIKEDAVSAGTAINLTSPITTATFPNFNSGADTPAVPITFSGGEGVYPMLAQWYKQDEVDLPATPQTSEDEPLVFTQGYYIIASY